MIHRSLHIVKCFLIYMPGAREEWCRSDYNLLYFYKTNFSLEYDEMLLITVVECILYSRNLLLLF